MKIGSTFTGYGGLDIAAREVLDAETAWFVENDPAAARILTHRWPEVPNLGDITSIDWAGVEPVDVLTGGFPCQDLSHAGNRAGLRDGTRSGLWAHMATAIDTLRPGLVVIENVRGILSAGADSDLEQCPWCMGDDPGGALRALGALLGDLADLGYDAQWQGVRAADIGAPHGRFRVFILAWPTDAESYARRVGDGDRSAPADTDSVGLEWGRTAWDRWDGSTDGPFLPTPMTDPDSHNGHARNLGREVQLLPTPTSMDSHSSGGGYNGQTNVTLTDATVLQPQQWGIYTHAITRWEHLTRPAPAPTRPGKTGNPQLNAEFTEWMMGLPAGHVTAVPGLTRNQQLKALGNGVVPQQAVAALRSILGSRVAP